MRLTRFNLLYQGPASAGPFSCVVAHALMNFRRRRRVFLAVPAKGTDTGAFPTTQREPTCIPNADAPRR
jgi:hypothetical protein